MFRFWLQWLIETSFDVGNFIPSYTSQILLWQIRYHN